MRLIGCDLRASQQSIAMLDRDTGAVIEKTLKREGEAVRREGSNEYDKGKRPL